MFTKYPDLWDYDYELIDKMLCGLPPGDVGDVLRTLEKRLKNKTWEPMDDRYLVIYVLCDSVTEQSFREGRFSLPDIDLSGSGYDSNGDECSVKFATCANWISRQFLI